MTIVIILTATFLASVLFTCSCSTSQSPIIDPTILIGKIERETLNTPQYPWFQKNSELYPYNEPIIQEIKKNKENVSVLSFVGLWCGDCKRQVPPFCKIMEKAEIQNLQIIGLDRQKKSTEGLESSYSIIRVPTFIFLKQGKEIGRIIETPKKTLEEDTLEILLQN